MPVRSLLSIRRINTPLSLATISSAAEASGAVVPMPTRTPVKALELKAWVVPVTLL